ncbi:MAG: hypothetical protein U0414_22810 [Polyangiaceae bacterium]
MRRRPPLALLVLFAPITIACGSSPPRGEEPTVTAPSASASAAAAQGTAAPPSRVPKLEPLWQSDEGMPATNLVASGDKLYFFRPGDPNSAELVSVPIAGGKPTVVAQGLPGDLIIANNYPVHDGALYVWKGSEILKITLATGAVTTTPTDAAGVGTLAADASGLYVQEAEDVFRIRFDGKRTKLATLRGATPSYGAQWLASTSDSLWVMTGSPTPKVFHLSARDGHVLGETTLPSPPGAEWHGAIVADGDGAIAVSSANRTTTVLRLGAQESKLLEIAGHLNDACDVRVDAQRVYFTLMDPSLEKWTLYRLPKSGGEPLALPSPEEGYEVLADRGEIYVLSHVWSSVWRLSQ